VADPEYFTLVELRALPQMADATLYSEARCLAAAAHVTAVIERFVDTSFIARTVTSEIHDGGGNVVFLKKPWALSVTTATENGTAVTDTLRLKDQRVLRYSSATTYTPKSWLAGCDNVAITYQAGYSATVPSDIKEAALRATRLHLLATNSNAAPTARQTQLVTENGTVTLPPASSDRPFGQPDIDSVILGWRAKLRGPLA